MKYITFFTGILIICFSSVSAEDPPVIFTDVPEDTSQDVSVLLINEVNLEAEFIELWNAGTEILDLTMLQFSELSADTEKRHDVSDFATSLSLEPNKFLVLNMSRLLNNSGEIIRLYASSEPLEAFTTLVIPSSETGMSYARQEDGSYVWQSPTPGEINIPDDPDPPDPEPIPDPPPQNLDGFILNEIDLEAEFLEFWNSGTETLDLAHFEFSEISGDTEKRHAFADFTDDLLLQPDSFLVLNMSAKLNNTGEIIRIYSHPEETVPFQEIEITDPEFGKSFARDAEGMFHWTLPTPGEANVFVPEDPDPPPEDPFDLTNEDFTHIVLSEIDLHEEFIEILNTGTEDADLSTFEFSELSGENEIRRSFMDFVENWILEPGAYLLISTSSKLNNTGEVIKIYIHPTATDPLQTLIVPKMNEGQSYALSPNGIFMITTRPTPGAENSILAPRSRSSGGSSSGSKAEQDFFETKSEYQSIARDKVTLLISEVSFKDQDHDMIEILCVECGSGEEPLDLQGFRLFDDKIFFEFPPETFVTSGDMIVIQFRALTGERLKVPYGWQFLIPHKGLTSTDETLVLLDSNDTIEDALCWTDHNGKYSPGEKADIGFLRARGEWANDQYREYGCFPSKSIASRMSLARKGTQDTNAAQDFFPTALNTFGSPNPNPLMSAQETEIYIEQLLFLPNESGVLITVRNRGDKTVSLGGFHLRNRTKIISQLPETDLYPGETTSLFFNSLPPYDLFLSLQDGWGTIEDFLCLNSDIVSEYEDKKSFLFEIYRKRHWHSRYLDSCISADLSQGGVLRTTSDLALQQTEEFTFSLLTKEDMTSSRGLFVSQLLPNPEGEDALSEFLELKTHTEIQNLSSWILVVGDKMFPLPGQSLSPGEVVRFTSADDLPTLRNTQGSVLLISPEGVIYETAWKNAKEGEHLFLQNGELFWDSEQPILQKEAPLLFEISSTPNFISAFEIISALPNPEGKDSGNETVSIKNISGEEGTLSGFFLSNGKTIKSLPDIFFHKDQIQVFVGSTLVPNLRNTAGEISLTTSSGESTDSLSWTKAREGELFGAQGSLRVLSSPSKKTSAPKKSSSAKKSSSPKKEDIIISGVLESFSATSLVITLPDGITQEFFFDEKNPQHIFLLSQVLHTGQEIQIQLSTENTIMEIDTASQTPFLQASLLPILDKTPRLFENSIILTFLILIFSGAACGICIVFLGQQKKSKNN